MWRKFRALVVLLGLSSLVGFCMDKTSMRPIEAQGLGLVPQADEVQPTVVEQTPPVAKPAAECKEGEFLIVVGGTTIKELILAGRYDTATHEISDRHFSTRPNREELCIRLEKELDKKLLGQGYHLASVEELISFGAQHPDEQCKWTVVPIKGESSVYLTCFGARRGVFVDTLGTIENRAFALVRKP